MPKQTFKGKFFEVEIENNTLLSVKEAAEKSIPTDILSKVSRCVKSHLAAGMTLSDAYLDGLSLMVEDRTDIEDEARKEGVSYFLMARTMRADITTNILYEVETKALQSQIKESGYEGFGFDDFEPDELAEILNDTVCKSANEGTCKTNVIELVGTDNGSFVEFEEISEV